jgi:putative transposase
MKRARFTEERIIGVLREHEAGARTVDLARKQILAPAPTSPAYLALAN